MIYQDVTFKSNDNLVLGDGVQTDSVKPTAGTAYKRGDLLVISQDNEATHGQAHHWHVICLADISAEQADKALEQNMEIPVYTQGEFNVLAVSVNGALLNESDRDKARACANSGQSCAIELRLPR